MEGGNVGLERDNLSLVYIEQAKFSMNTDKNLKSAYDSLEEAIKI
jgi:tetratricopeptide repeat protein 21B